jgi:hypothetical protein
MELRLDVQHLTNTMPSNATTKQFNQLTMTCLEK